MRGWAAADSHSSLVAVFVNAASPPLGDETLAGLTRSLILTPATSPGRAVRLWSTDFTAAHHPSAGEREPDDRLHIFPLSHPYWARLPIQLRNRNAQPQSQPQPTISAYGSFGVAPRAHTLRPCPEGPTTLPVSSLSQLRTSPLDGTEELELRPPSWMVTMRAMLDMPRRDRILEPDMIQCQRTDRHLTLRVASVWTSGLALTVMDHTSTRTCTRPHS
ncbi:hypothetical protein G7046_g6734 [Stylonectria norvegica]|nr:hypothetical protein G7046_g6734 [Stylonectria norvegica]